jgi:hypothetical protein
VVLVNFRQFPSASILLSILAFIILFAFLSSSFLSSKIDLFFLLSLFAFVLIHSLLGSDASLEYIDCAVDIISFFTYTPDTISPVCLQLSFVVFLRMLLRLLFFLRFISPLILTSHSHFSFSPLILTSLLPLSHLSPLILALLTPPLASLASLPAQNMWTLCGPLLQALSDWAVDYIGEISVPLLQYVAKGASRANRLYLHRYHA